MAGATKLMTAGGGGVSLTPASSIASDVTVQVPSQNCTLGIQGPAFSAYRATSAQSISSNVWTKVQLNAENFDTNNCFDSSTNYRFTPTVAGYYQIQGTIHNDYTSSGGNGYLAVGIYKNGSIYMRGLATASANNYLYGGFSVSTLVYMNGSTDYLELYGINQNPTPNFGVGSEYTQFSGTLVRAA